MPLGQLPWQVPGVLPLKGIGYPWFRQLVTQVREGRILPSVDFISLFCRPQNVIFFNKNLQVHEICPNTYLHVGNKIFQWLYHDKSVIYHVGPAANNISTGKLHLKPLYNRTTNYQTSAMFQVPNIRGQIIKQLLVNVSLIEIYVSITIKQNQTTTSNNWHYFHR